MAISSPGIGSNLDVNSIVSQLMQLEAQPLQALSLKEARLQTRLSAIGSFKGALGALQSALAPLTSANTFAASRSAKASNGEVTSVTASATAAIGTHSLNVTQLAQSQKLATDTFAATTASVGSGTLTIQFGTDTGSGFTANPERSTISIAIGAAQSTLAGIRDAINEAKAGISASIVNDGTGYRLAITSTSSGTANSLRITVDDDDGVDTDQSGLSLLAYDPAGTKNLSEKAAAKDALFSIDGIDIVKASNTASDAIDGLTISLLATGSSTITVSSSATGTAQIEAFIKAYNDFNANVRNLAGFNAETKTGGPLQGDATVRSIQTQLRSALSGSLPASTNGGLRTLSEIGISFQKDGSLALDKSKLQAAIDDPTKDLSTLFARIGKASDASIDVVSTTSTLRSGSFAIDITTLPTAGSALAGLSSTFVSTGVNDSFSLLIDGIAASITLPEANYSIESLASELQSRFNGTSVLSNAGKSVTVSGTGTQGTLTGSAGPNLTIDGTNDDLSVTLNGVTRNLTLASGTYTLDGLITELQTRVNTAFTPEGFQISVSDAGGLLALTSALVGPNSAITVSGEGAADLLGGAPVAATGTGSLTITSGSFGSTSKVSGVTSDLLAGADVATDGADVAGTIGGAAGVGSGKELRGDGSASGLTIRVNGGATGDRGTVSYSTGFAAQLDSLLTRLLASDGPLKGKTDSIDTSVELIDQQRETLNRRLIQIEARYRKQFTALDTLMSSMLQTSTFLQQQLASLSGLNQQR